MTTFQPRQGDLFARAFNDHHRVLVVECLQETGDGGRFVNGVICYRDGTYSSVRLLSVYATDLQICFAYPMPATACKWLADRAFVQNALASGKMDDAAMDTAKACGMHLIPTFPKGSF